MPQPGSSPRLASQVCTITGSSSNLGSAIAFAVASHGASLIIYANLSPLPQLYFRLYFL